MANNDRNSKNYAASLEKTASKLATALANRLKNISDNLSSTASAYMHPERPKMMVEGDSWTCYPPPVNKDLTDFLKADYIITNEAAAKDLMRNMSSAANIRHLQNKIRKDQIRLMFLSAGGNDMLGARFKTMIQENPNAMSAEDFIIEANFTRALDELIGYFQLMVTALCAQNPRLTIYTHSYVDPIPLPKGSWLGRQMAAKNIPDIYWQPIIKILLTSFRQRLDHITNERFIHININDDFPNDPSLWHNEIHLNASGLEIAAERIHKRIQADIKRGLSV